ncbi:MAG: hypothetical protein R6U32_01890 [Candidatus Woesearchaeota archaeon]
MADDNLDNRVAEIYNQLSEVLQENGCLKAELNLENIDISQFFDIEAEYNPAAFIHDKTLSRELGRFINDVGQVVEDPSSLIEVKPGKRHEINSVQEHVRKVDEGQMEDATPTDIHYASMVRKLLTEPSKYFQVKIADDYEEKQGFKDICERLKSFATRTLNDFNKDIEGQVKEGVRNLVEHIKKNPQEYIRCTVIPYEDLPAEKREKISSYIAEIMNEEDELTPVPLASGAPESRNNGSSNTHTPPKPKMKPEYKGLSDWWGLRHIRKAIKKEKIAGTKYQKDFNRNEQKIKRGDANARKPDDVPDHRLSTCILTDYGNLSPKDTNKEGREGLVELMQYDSLKDAVQSGKYNREDLEYYNNVLKNMRRPFASEALIFYAGSNALEYAAVAGITALLMGTAGYIGHKHGDEIESALTSKPPKVSGPVAGVTCEPDTCYTGQACEDNCRDHFLQGLEGRCVEGGTVIPMPKVKEGATEGPCEPEIIYKEKECPSCEPEIRYKTETVYKTRWKEKECPPCPEPQPRLNTTGDKTGGGDGHRIGNFPN